MSSHHWFFQHLLTVFHIFSHHVLTSRMLHHAGQKLSSANAHYYTLCISHHPRHINNLKHTETIWNEFYILPITWIPTKIWWLWLCLSMWIHKSITKLGHLPAASSAASLASQLCQPNGRVYFQIFQRSRVNNPKPRSKTACKNPRSHHVLSCLVEEHEKWIYDQLHVISLNISKYPLVN